MISEIRKIIDKFRPVSQPSLSLMEELFIEEEVKKNDTFITKDQRINKEYFLLSGICKSFVVSPEGEEITLAFYTDESILAPHFTRTRSGISSVNFRALTDCRLVSMDARAFEQLMIDHVDIRDFGNAVLHNELITKVDKEIGLASLTAKERLADFRVRFKSLENYVPHTDIASYLGITNISLSRLRKDLKE